MTERRSTRKRQVTASQTAHPGHCGDDATLVDLAYGQIEELIVTLELKPGTLLSEGLLVRRLGIGRTPVREALHRLARERLVVILPRRGIFVSDLNIAAQLKLGEVRRELERLIARAAARRASDAERARLRTIGEGMEAAAETDDGHAFMRLDRDFNATMAAAARNEFAQSAMGLMSGLARRFWFVHYKQVADLPKAARLHAAVAFAVAAGDAEGAARTSDRLLDYIEDFTRATLDVGLA
jgi:DNA-binding GntR family transcriptional regulator